ncbi:hypothetical protein Tco_1367569 [Tanacetum coccineum]
MASESTSSQQSQQLIPSSKWDEPLSFTQYEFISAIGLPISKEAVPLPPKETVRAGLVTLGLFDKENPTLSSTVLIDIEGIIFSYLVHKLQNGKKNMELNIFYTRFLSLMFEKLLGKDYASNDLTLVKPHTIIAASFQKPLATEVPLTSHILKVAKLFEESEQPLIPPSGEVNTDDTADKSLSRASVRVILSKKQVTETQHAEVTVATADATKSLVASKLTEEQGNQLLAVEAKKEVAEEQSLEFLTVEQLLDEADKLNKAIQETSKSPYDTESEIKVVKSYFTNQIPKVQDQIMHDSDESADVQEDSEYESMPKDDLRSILGFEAADSNNTQGNDMSHSNNIFQDDNASAERLSLPGHMDHICKEVSSLHSKLKDMESSIIHQVLAKIKSSLLALVSTVL